MMAKRQHGDRGVVKRKGVRHGLGETPPQAVKRSVAADQISDSDRAAGTRDLIVQETVLRNLWQITSTHGPHLGRATWAM